MSDLRARLEGHDLVRDGCPHCDGGGCRRCDYTGFRPDQRTFDTGYGWRRLVFWPWHYIQHVRRGVPNGWYSRLFCTWCVDNRMREFYAEEPVSAAREKRDRQP